MSRASINKTSFGTLENGREIDIYSLTNSRGSEVRIMTYGGAVVSLKVPDKSGAIADVVLGFDTIGDYERHSPYFGAIVGRYANRISKGKFEIGGKTYELACNNGENHLHGGFDGFNRVVWTAEAAMSPEGPILELAYLSKDGEEGYPGDLQVRIAYTLTDKDELQIVYSAVTDQATIVNLSNHSYFNLAGAGNGTILDHRLMIKGGAFLPTDAGSIPTGEIRPVGGTAFDFREPTAIGSRIGQDDQQLEFGRGYDHNWILDKGNGGLTAAATVHEPRSGRLMTVLTTEPGLQFYSGNFLDGVVSGKGGKSYPHRSGLCLEAQHFPDSPNRPEFPTTILRPGETYSQTTIYRFEVS